MVDIKAYYLANSSHSERQTTSAPPTQLAEASAPTQNGPKTDRSTASVETTISIKAQIFYAFNGLRSSLETRSGANMKEQNNVIRALASRDPSDISRTVTSSGPVMRQQGATQIIVFRLAQNAQSDTLFPPPSGPVKLSVGITEQALTIGPGKNTLGFLVQSLNGILGLKACLLRTREGLIFLLKSLPGPSNALPPASIETLWRIIQPASLPQSRPFVGLIDEIPAADARGASTGSARNFVDGSAMNYRIVATTHCHAHLRPKETMATLQNRLAALIREVNATITFLANISKRGISKGTNICPEDRIFAQALLDRLRKIATRPVYGFASYPILPGDVGLEVGEDGFLTFNKAYFKIMYEQRQDLVEAMVGPNDNRSDMLISPHVKETDLSNPGVYTLIYDPTNTSVIATLDGYPLLERHDNEGRAFLLLRTQAQEIAISLTKDTPMETELVYRLSLFDQLAGFAATVLQHETSNQLTGTAQDSVYSSAQQDDLPADKMIIALLAQSSNQSDMAQTLERDSISPQATELLFYLLWIGLFIPRVDRDRRKKHHRNRRPKVNGSSVPVFGQLLSGRILAQKDDS